MININHIAVTSDSNNALGETWLAADLQRLIEQIDFSIKLQDAVFFANVQDVSDGVSLRHHSASVVEAAVLGSCRKMLSDTLRLLKGAGHVSLI